MLKTLAHEPVKSAAPISIGGKAECLPVPKYIPSLTGIRGIAALWVVLFHMWYLPGAPAIMKLPIINPVLGNGWVGVDLFFILSGFILMHSHMRDFTLSPVGAAPRFYTSRFLRVYPLNAVVLLLIALLIAVDREFASHQENLSVAGFLKTLTLSTCWMLPGKGEWNEPVWSLSAEVVGYAVFPLFAFLIARVRSERLACGIVVSCILMLLALLWYRHHLGENVIHGPTALFRMGTEFTAGIAAYRLRTLARRISAAKTIEFLSVAGLLVILIIPRWSAFAPFAFAALLYALSFKSGGPIHRFLSSKVAIILGRISFPLYLVHLMPLSWLRFHASGGSELLLNATYLATVLALAALLHYYVERAFSRGKATVLQPVLST